MTRHKELCRELAKLVSASFGASPKGFGKVGLTHPELKSFSLKIADENDLTKTIDVWYGEARGALDAIAALVTSPREGEFIIVFGFKNDFNEFKEAPIYGFRFDWESESDSATWLISNAGQWVQLDLLRKMNLAVGMESMVQEGATWMPGQVPEKLKECLVSLIEVDEPDQT